MSPDGIPIDDESVQDATNDSKSRGAKAAKPVAKTKQLPNTGMNSSSSRSRASKSSVPNVQSKANKAKAAAANAGQGTGGGNYENKSANGTSKPVLKAAPTSGTIAN